MRPTDVGQTITGACPTCGRPGYVTRRFRALVTEIDEDVIAYAHAQDDLARLRRAAIFAVRDRATIPSHAICACVEGGSNIFDATAEGVEVATSENRPVAFVFNDRLVICPPNGDADAIARAWRESAIADAAAWAVGIREKRLTALAIGMPEVDLHSGQGAPVLDQEGTASSVGCAMATASSLSAGVAQQPAKGSRIANDHEKRAWRVLLELGADLVDLGGKQGIDVRPIRVHDQRKMAQLADAIANVVGRSGAHRWHMDSAGRLVFVVSDCPVGT